MWHVHIWCHYCHRVSSQGNKALDEDTFLKLNDDKTGKLNVTPHQPVVIVETPLAPKNSARNLDVIFDSLLSMDKHTNSICKHAFHRLRNIHSIRQSLDKTAEARIHLFVTIRLENGNSLLYGLSKQYPLKLQWLRNIATHVLTDTKKYSHINLFLVKLQELVLRFWLLHSKPWTRWLRNIWSNFHLTTYTQNRPSGYCSKSQTEDPIANIWW